MQSIVVEVNGLKKEEQQDYSNPGKVKVTYAADFRNPDVAGGFYCTMRFADPAEAPRIGDRFTLTLTPVVESHPG